MRILHCVLFSLVCASFAVVAGSTRISADTQQPTIPAVPLEEENLVKVPAPPAAQREESIKALKEIYKDEIFKFTAAARLALAQKMIDQAAAIKDDAAGRFVLLSQAAMLGAQAGDLPRFIVLRGKLLSSFEVDAKELTEFDTTALNHLMTAAKEADPQDPGLAKILATFKTLAEKPDDPAANLAAGRYIWFTLDNAALSLPYLAKSSQAPLSAVAMLDLATPVEAAAQTKIGDAWWDLAEKAQKSEANERRAFQQRAAYWYSRAAKDATGLLRTKLELRLKGAAQAAVAAGQEKELVRLNGAGVAFNQAWFTKELPELSVTIPKERDSGRYTHSGGNQTMPAGVYNLTAPIITREMKQIIIPAGTLVQNGKITMNKGFWFTLEGTAEKPVVFRNVEFIAADECSITSRHGIFINCKFNVSNLRPPAKTKAESQMRLWGYETLFYKCEYTEETQPLIYFYMHHCIFAGMTIHPVHLLPATTASQSDMDSLINYWMNVNGSLFIDCKVHPTFFWYTDFCSFVNCAFLPQRAELAGFKDPSVQASLTGCAGNPSATSIPSKLIRAKAVYAVPFVPAALTDLQPLIAQLNAVPKGYKWISKNAVYSVSSTNFGRRPNPQLLLCDDSGFNCAETKHDEAGDVIIDLGAVQPVGAVEISKGHNGYAPHDTGFTLWTGDSEDGPWTKQWEELRIRSWHMVEFDKPAQARYVRLSQTKVESLALSAVRVFAR